MSVAILPILPVARAAALPIASESERWLVRTLWSHLAVGFIGGHPKSGKSWLALDLAVSVASGTDCLGSFAVEQRGPALVYLAEDALPRVRERLASICTHRGLALEDLDLWAITSPRLRLDTPGDQERLEGTVAMLKPRLLVLDPLVRLHTGDENSSADVSALLGFLRGLSREHQLALVLVHHMTKKGHSQLGQALRGSSDLHAWSDSAAYLTRHKGQLLLTLEHRAAPAPEPVALALVTGTGGETPHLERVRPRDAVDEPPSLDKRIETVLRKSTSGLSRAALRSELKVNNHRLGETLAQLERDGRARRSAGGWALGGADATGAAPAEQMTLPDLT